MILSANEIKQRISTGEIKIQDFDEARLGPNSYNLRLDEDLMVYREAVLDPGMTTGPTSSTFRRMAWCCNPASCIWHRRWSTRKPTDGCCLQRKGMQ